MYIGISNFEGKSLENELQDKIHCLQKQADIQSWHSNNSNSARKNPV
jgi:hypothetical protein